MRLSVTPKEIAEHLIEELGHQQAIEKCKLHLNRCCDDITREIWENIDAEMTNLLPIEQH